MKEWHDASGNQVSENTLFCEIASHVDSDGKVFIGTDSTLKGGMCIFASSICLHGAKGQRGGRYFFKRKKDSKKSFEVLRLRITQEVQISIDIGLKILEKDPNIDIEIHIDIGTTHRSKTRDLVDMMMAWTKSIGFKCKVKPYAWASASVADKHTK